jgi:hypothetical protein
MSKTTVSYVCPSCQRSTNDATITTDYQSTANDRTLRPEVPAAHANEQLHCPCGKVYTWFSAMQVTTRDRT